MPLPDSRNDAIATVIPPPPVPQPATDPELEDWNAYYQLLLAGKLSNYGGELVVVRDGNVIAHGNNPDELRSNLAKQLGLAENKLVVPFVDNDECISAE